MIPATFLNKILLSFHINVFEYFIDELSKKLDEANKIDNKDKSKIIDMILSYDLTKNWSSIKLTTSGIISLLDIKSLAIWVIVSLFMPS